MAPLLPFRGMTCRLEARLWPFPGLLASVGPLRNLLPFATSGPADLIDSDLPGRVSAADVLAPSPLPGTIACPLEYDGVFSEFSDSAALWPRACCSVICEPNEDFLDAEALDCAYSGGSFLLLFSLAKMAL